MSLCPAGGVGLCPGGDGVSVQGGLYLGVSVREGLCQGGPCPGGSLSRGWVSCQGDPHRRTGTCHSPNKADEYEKFNDNLNNFSRKMYISILCKQESIPEGCILPT